MFKICNRQLTFVEHIRKGGLENLILTGCVEGMRCRGKERVTYSIDLCKCMEEQGQGVIVKC